MRACEEIYGDLDDIEMRRLDLLLYRRFAPHAHADFAHRLWRHLRTRDVDFERVPAWSLSRLLGEAVDRERDLRAIRNVADYYYESRFLGILGQAQRERYFESIHRRARIAMDVDVTAGPWPILIELLHHRWLFPSIALLLGALKARTGLERILLLRRFRHRDCRLDAIFDYVKQRLDCQVSDISFETNWYRRLKAEVSGKTAVLYFGDMSPRLFAPRAASRGWGGRLLLAGDKDGGRFWETYSVAPKLAGRLGLRHLIFDIPGDSRFQLREAGLANVLRCPAEQWSFWPALELYSHRPCETRHEPTG